MQPIDYLEFARQTKFCKTRPAPDPKFTQGALKKDYEILLDRKIPLVKRVMHATNQLNKKMSKINKKGG
jgi:hypothetical protein